MQVGERLRAVRESKKMSQGDIEKQTGLLRCYLSRCENGHTVPSLETLEKWTRALGVSLAQLFSGNEPAPKMLPVFKFKNGHKLNREAENGLRRVGSAFAKMQPRDINLVVGLASKFAQR